MEKRSRVRLPRRLTCRIKTNTDHAAGFVQDVSRNGLFVQTDAAPPTNSLVEVIFSSLGNQPDLRIEAGVARKRTVTRRYQPTAQAGLGLEVIPPRDSYERRIFGPAEPALMGSSSTTHYAFAHEDVRPIVATPEPSARGYRFRMLRHDRSMSKVLTVYCASEASARAQALISAGPGWKIAEAETL